MFLDLVFNFCCSKRQKNEQDTLSHQSRKSDEEQFAEARRQELDVGKCALNIPANSHKSPSSIISPTDNYLLLNQQPVAKKMSFEDEEQQYPLENLSKTTYHLSNTTTLKRCQSNEDLKQVGLKKKISKNKAEEGKRVVKIWEPEEDELLRKYHTEYNGNWHKIAPMVPGRNISQCSQRWRRISPIQVKQKWTLVEDQKVIELVKKKGKNWTMLAKDFPGRTGKQIRERYLNKLDPCLQQGPWDKADDDTILEMYKEIGPKWSVIAAKLNGRSENMVKNRFYSHIQKVALGRQNKYQIVVGNNSQMDIECSDSSEIKLPYSENHSSSMGSSTFTFSYHDEDDMDLYDNGDDEFRTDFFEKANIN